MKCSILHESAGRLRVRLHCPAMTLRQADVLEYYLRAVDGVTEVKVYDRTRDAVVCFACGRGDVIASLAAFSFPPAGSPSYPRRLKCRFPHVCPGFTGRPKADRPLFPLRDPAAHAACFIVWGFPNAPFILILDRLGRLCCFFR